METIVCQGCGVTIQSTDQNEAGFLPASALDKEEIICKRCFRLKHYNEVQDVSYTDEDFIRIISEIRNTDALIVKLVDIFDFNGSFIKSLHRLTGKNKILLAGNKVDLLPKSTNKNKLKHWMMQSAKEAGLPVADAYLFSAVRGTGIEELQAAIEQYRDGKDVYVVGSTNVGKSTFINRLISETTGVKEAITTSYFPGTTLGFIEIPMDEKSAMYDTPGVVNRQQISHYLSEKDLKLVTPSKEIKPRVYQLNEKQTLFIGGLARLDFEAGEKQAFVCYFSNRLDIHRTKLENADQLYENHIGGLLSPPTEESLEKLPPFTKDSYRVKKEKTDVVIPGLGWITLTGVGASVTIHTPEGIKPSIRNALI